MTPAIAKEHGILFSAPMVLALLDGRKTCTRRLSKRWLRVKAGDRLWVRETWQDFCPMWGGHWCGHGTEAGKLTDHRPVYRADDPALWIRGDNPDGPAKWRPSIHMPHWASRITLEATEDAREERLLDITEAEAVAEGVERRGSWWACYSTAQDKAESARASFSSLWNQLHGDTPTLAWDFNPTVVRLAFRRVSALVDECGTGE